MARPAQQRSTGTKPTESGGRSSRSSGSSRSRAPRGRTRHLVCLSNAGYPASLERRKIYVALVDRQADRAGMVRVIDESGEDYLYPKALFAELEVSASLAKAIASAT